MSTLEKWNPFRFFRRSKDGSAQEGEGSTAIQTQDRTAALQRRDMVDPFTSMTRIMDAMLRDPFAFDPFAPFDQVDRWFGDFSPARYGVSVDVVDEGSALRVDFELPGMSKDDVSLSLDNGALVLTGEKRQDKEVEEKGVYRSERYFGSIRRTVPLPRDLDFEAAEARFKDGLLSVRFPKKPTGGSEARTIPVN